MWFSFIAGAALCWSRATTALRLKAAPIAPDMAVPKQTGADREMMAHKPATTARAESPGLGGMELVKRYPGYTMGADTCGFIGSAASVPFTCVRNSATCTNNGGFIGCCTTEGEACFSTIKTACIPYTESRSRCSSTSDYRTICCSSALPECYTYTFTASSVSPSSILTIHDCDSKAGTGVLLDYPPNITKDGPRPSTTPSASATTTPPSNTPSNTITVTAPPPIETTSAAATASSSTTNTGAIVGGAVGGAAVLALIGLGVFFTMRKRRNEPATPDRPVSTLSPTAAAGGIYPSSVSPGTVGTASQHASGAATYADKTATVYSVVSNPTSAGSYPPGGGQWVFLPDASVAEHQQGVSVQGQHLSGYFAPETQGNGGYQGYNPGTMSGEFVPATGHEYVTRTVPIEGQMHHPVSSAAMGSGYAVAGTVPMPVSGQEGQAMQQARDRPASHQYPSG